MRHDPRTIGGHLDTRTCPGSVHLESAFLLGDLGPSTSPESLTAKALSIIYTPDSRRDLEESGLVWAFESFI
jgi:hypothetical protein